MPGGLTLACSCEMYASQMLSEQMTSLIRCLAGLTPTCKIRKHTQSKCCMFSYGLTYNDGVEDKV